MILMGLQYLLTYEPQDSSSTIAFGLFAVMRIWIPTWRIPLQFLLSLVFPDCCVLRCTSSRRAGICILNMCLVIFAVAAATAYSLYCYTRRSANLERQLHLGRLYSAIFLLMFASLLFLLEQHPRERQLG